MQDTRPTNLGLRVLLGLAAVIVIVAGLRTASTLLMPLAVAGFLAMVSYPLVVWLQRRRVPKSLAITLTLTALLTTLLGPGLVIYGAAIQFAAAAPRYEAQLRTMTLGSFEWLEARGVDTTRLSDILNWSAVLDFAGGLFTNVALLLSNALLVLLVVTFILAEASGIPTKLARAFPRDPLTAARFDRVTGEVQRYLRVKTFVSVATGVLAGIWTALLDVDFAILWGLLAFLLNYIPNLGSIMAAVPPILLALVLSGPGSATAVAGGFVAINIGLGNIAEPYLMGRQLRLSPLVVVLALVFWGWLWGPVGMVLAVPMTMVLRILVEHPPELRWIAELMAGGHSDQTLITSPHDPVGGVSDPRAPQRGSGRAAH